MIAEITLGVTAMDELGKNIKSARKQKRYTQSELARLVNVSSQVVSNWERGYSRPAPDSLNDLARVLEVSVDELLGNDSSEKEKEEENEEYEKMFAYGGFDDMSEEEMQELKEYADLMRRRRKRLEKLFKEDGDK